MHAAANLAEISALPYRRLHPLKGEHSDKYSIDIDSQYRIWFTIVDRERIEDDDGYVEFSEVTSIEICLVGDPHD